MILRSAGFALIGLTVYYLTRWVGLSLAWSRGGPGFAFREGTVLVTGAWLLLSLALALGAGFLAGWIAGSLGGSRPVQLVAGFLLVAGVVGLATAARRERVEPPEDLAGLGVREALVVAEAPGWLAVVEPLLATAGALVGGAGRQR